MKYLFHLGHPAHFHLFKNIIQQLNANGHQTMILIKKKDILESLLQNANIGYHNIMPKGRTDSKIGIAIGMLKTDWRLFKYALKHKPDVMIGTSFAISHVGKILRIPSINVNEDDFDIVPLYSKLSYPWASVVLAPDVCKTGKWSPKTIAYNGYHELAYLHPNHFTPNKDIVRKYFNPDETFFIIRFAKLTAHHDEGIRGISTLLAQQIIEKLTPHGKIYITSERPLEPVFEAYRMAINPLDIHHVMAFAQLYIGDSQTMAAEAGVLGTPFIRFNDFVGKIGYLNDLEIKYQLGYGITPDHPEALLTKIDELMNITGRNDIFRQRRAEMLSDKIDTAAFISWFVENYPASLSLIKNKERWAQFK